MKCCTKCQEWMPTEDFPVRHIDIRRPHIAPGRNTRCNRCIYKSKMGTLHRSKEVRQEERRRSYARKGKPYIPRGELCPWWKRLGKGMGGAVNLKAHGWRTRIATRDDYWLKRLRAELPHLYDSSKDTSALVFRARYNLDHEYKAKEIERAHKRRSDEEHGRFFSDGTLTGPAIRRLFGEATDCLYCGEHMRSEQKTLDHVWARRLGGWHSITNAVICCYSCNSKKHGMSPTRWLKRVSPERQAQVLKAWRTVGVVLTQPQLAC